MTSFTAWTTRVSNPVCSPRFRTSVSVSVQAVAFATGVPSYIYAFHRYTGNSTTLYHTLACQFWMQFPG
ncbi:hypothetical protein ALO63_102747 [Pseudomonas amygdali pv. mori]|uniref:Uncharacterized protein n=1 Tax=Pseudomonas amygdali pv. mori TaxID=34065 RepID=A0A0P9X3M7_PSEA0|nr:hypothetical protein ALO63_102747 [Pseudomonas amygdali pv. mori]